MCVCTHSWITKPGRTVVVVPLTWNVSVIMKVTIREGAKCHLSKQHQDSGAAMNTGAWVLIPDILLDLNRLCVFLESCLLVIQRGDNAERSLPGKMEARITWLSLMQSTCSVASPRSTYMHGLSLSKGGSLTLQRDLWLVAKYVKQEEARRAEVVEGKTGS